MNCAYVDSSCLVAIAFEEPGYRDLIEQLESYHELFASTLLEAEFRSALVREGMPGDAEMLNVISWIVPHRPLSSEITQVLSYGYLRGADLWHLACALFLAPSPRELCFASLDNLQLQVAQRLGFPPAGD